MVKERILFMCVRNASRSQMVEGFFRDFYGDKFDVFSAGSDPQEIDPIAVQVMDEIGIDISKQASNSLKDYEGQEFDYVVIICGNEYNSCPFFFGGKKLFLECLKDIYPFKGTEKEEIRLQREIRDEIGDWIQDFYNYKICDATYNEPNCCDLKTNTQNDADDDKPCC
ncbi:MAG: arsenate reductase ArsC [Methanobacterium sp.]|uniref:arsenate reductase ArsC n=1 Tax=Methanobacterium sp. TaxID=2164 RepID=UPI003D655814|nr:arsenate reductase ArsC [Methanobacterium sp.]